MVGREGQPLAPLSGESQGPRKEDMLGGPVIKRLRSDEELGRCADLLRRAFGTVAREYGLTEQSAPTNAAFTTRENLCRHLQDGMALYGMFREGSLIGCVATKRAKANNLVFSVERLAVAPEMRHRGYGGQLLSFALESIRREGGMTASLGLMDNNDVLKKWYRARGFEQRDCRKIAHLPFKVCYMSIGVGRKQDGQMPGPGKGP